MLDDVTIGGQHWSTFQIFTSLHPGKNWEWGHVDLHTSLGREGTGLCYRKWKIPNINEIPSEIKQQRDNNNCGKVFCKINSKNI